jgi:glycosyltransferase involved in cell wall biosynthesis
VKIIYYSKYSALGPSSRYRAFQFQESFRRSGIDFQISELFDDHYFDILRAPSGPSFFKKIPYTISRFRSRNAVLKANSSALAVIEQQLFPYIPFSAEKRCLPDRYLIEFDDAIYLTHPRKLPHLIEHAAGVIAGNETLATFARRFNQNVDVIPTVLDTKKFMPHPKPDRKKIILGWSGLEYNYPYLKTIVPVLRGICRRKDVELRILSGSPPGDFDLPYVFVKWDPDREVQQLNELDIGLMPLLIDEWCKGKCGFKLLQYMALEIPSVSTPVGVNTRIVQDGINGFLATAAEDWESKLLSLIENESQRATMGKAARSTVVSHYSTDTWFPKLADLYRSYAEKVR